MNKKSAFTVVHQLPQNMVKLTEFNAINVLLAVSNLLVGTRGYHQLFGMNIPKENKPISNWHQNIIAQPKPFNGL